MADHHQLNKALEAKLGDEPRLRDFRGDLSVIHRLGDAAVRAKGGAYCTSLSPLPWQRRVHIRVYTLYN